MHHELSDFTNPITCNTRNAQNLYVGEVPSGYKTVKLTSSSGNLNLGACVIVGKNGQIAYWRRISASTSETLSLTEDIKFIVFVLYTNALTDRDTIFTFS